MAAIEACTGARCELNAGEPDPLMLEAAMELLGLDAGDCLLTGDRLSTDIRMAGAAGMATEHGWQTHPLTAGRAVGVA